MGRGLKDPDLLNRIAKECPDAVLVTTDDHLPDEHAELVAKLRVTLAIVDAVAASGYSEEEWKHEVVHRWAHRMVDQPSGTIRRYGLRGSTPWRPRRRPRLRRLVRGRPTSAGVRTGGSKGMASLPGANQQDLPLT